MSWVGQLVQTTTGVVGAELRLSGAGSWTKTLNAVESWDVQVAKADLRRLPPAWRDPWRTSVLMSWRSASGRLTPWLYGPIVEPLEEVGSMVPIQCQGIGAILSRRIVLDRDYDGADVARPSADEMSKMTRSKVTLSGSYGAIAQGIVRLATGAKSGGALPIRYASPAEPGGQERIYPGFNIANNGAWKLLTELVETDDGPDVAFRPEWVDESQSMVRWAMHHGTNASPAIAQDYVMDLDTTAARGPASDIDVKVSTERIASRVYWSGAGQDAGTLIRMSQDLSRHVDGMPLLETVGSTSDSASAALVQSQADTELAAAGKAVRELSLKVAATDPRCEVGRWQVGDAASLTVGGRLAVPDGTREYRIVSAQGSWASPLVTLDLQEE